MRVLGRYLFALALVCMLAGAVPGATAQQDDSPVAALANMSWRSIGPANMGGRVTDILGIPGNRDTFWVGGADGGLWKTTNGGTTFTGQWQDEEAYSVGAVAMAPSDHNVLYLGSGEGDPRNSVSYGLGVWRSTDAGDSWTHVGLRGTERIKRIKVHPANPDIAWVCALGREWGPNEERGVFRTDDGGANWTKVLYLDEDTGCSDLDINLSNPRILYAGMWTFRRQPWRFDEGGKETAVYKSTDGGLTWKKLDVVSEPMARIGVAVAQSRPDTVYVITETKTKGTLFRSDDAGASWRMTSADRSINFRPFYYADLRVDPTNPEVVWTLSGSLQKSTDGGRNFTNVGQGVHGDHQALWIDPTDPDRVLSGSDGGYQVSNDGGGSWDIINNVVLAQYYQIFADDRDPYWVCGGLQDNGNWCGPSRVTNGGGFGGGGILKDEWYTVSGGDGFYAVPVPGKPNLIYSNAQGGYLRITDTTSGLTRSIEPYPRMIGSQGQGMYRAKYRFNWDAPIHVSPHDPGVVYWGGNVLFRSADYGHSWDIISPDLTTDDPDKQLDSGGEIYLDNTAAEFHSTILTIAESPLEAGVLWVGTDDGHVQVSRDGGQNWSLINAAIPGLPAEAWVSKIDASWHVAGRAFINVDQHRLDDFTPHVWRCDNYGASCIDLSAGLPQDDYTKVIREDPVNGDLLYVGMDRGLYASWDGGSSWHDLRLNLPRVSVRDIKVQRQYNDLVIGTHGRGAFILDDIAPLQQLAAARAEALHVFPIRLATWWQSWNSDASLGSREYRGENPPDGAYINYYLAEAPTAPVKIRISDAAGNLVQEFEERNAKAGVNRSIWNLRHSGAEPRQRGQQGGGGGFGRFLRNIGPPAIPGTYSATVMAGELEGSASFELRGDPRIDMTVDEYREAHEASKRLITLTNETNGMLDTVDGLTEQVTALRTNVADAEVENVEAVREQIGTALQELEALNDKLQRPANGMNYRDYPRLSEEVRGLMFGIMGAQAPPTEGQLTMLTELEGDTRRLRSELQGIIDGSIQQLNEMLGTLPAVVVPKAGGGSQ